MDNRKKYLLKNTAILTISNFATKILSFFLIPLYTGILSTSEYGIYDLVGTSVSLLFPIFTANIIDAVMRFSMDEKCSKNDIGRIGLIYVFRSNLFFLFLLTILSFTGKFNAINQYFIFIVLYYFTSSMASFMVQYAKGCEQVKDMGIAGVLSTICTIFFNVLFLVILRIGLKGFFLASILSLSITNLYYILRLDIVSRFKTGLFDKKLEKEMLSYCVPLVATTLSWWVNSSSDKYIVSYICGVSANGLLSIAYKLPNIMNMLQNIFTQAWQISAVKEYGNDETSRFYGNTFRIVNLLMCAACSWLIVLTRPLAGILFSNDFYDAWKFVPFLLLSSVINCASGILGPILGASMNSKALMNSALVGAVINLVLNIFLVKVIGVQGVTIATTISSFVIFFVRKKAVGGDIWLDNYSIVMVTWILLAMQALIEIYFESYVLEGLIMAVLLVINFGLLREMLYNLKHSFSFRNR